MKNRSHTRHFWLLSLILSIAFFALGWLIGDNLKSSINELDLTKFWKAYKVIQNRYVGEVNKDLLIEGSIRGLVDSLADPYSVYLSADEKLELETDLMGKFEGIGAELTIKNNKIIIVSPISGSPAQKAGLKPNDVILKIDDQETQSMSLDQAVQLIRGPKGTQVILSIIREGEADPREFKLIRENIKVDSVTWHFQDNIAIMEIRQFGPDTEKLAKKAAKEISAKQASAMIVDLRNNPGGYLNTVAPIVSLFVPPSVYVIEIDRKGRELKLSTSGSPILPDIPLYILVNAGSASAAEIFAGAMQDHRRATVIGQKTFGKGSVQDIIEFRDGSAIRLTIAKWLTPNRRVIDSVGIEPDVLINDNPDTDDDEILELALKQAKGR